jgi:hypothetical protein
MELFQKQETRGKNAQRNPEVDISDNCANKIKSASQRHGAFDESIRIRSVILGMDEEGVNAENVQENVQHDCESTV